MQLDDYLSRIGFDAEPAPTRDSLRALLRAHVFSVPFENLDVQLGRPVTTAVEPAFDKIVNRRRGGWCYEQNGLFGWALGEIGFGVTRVAASVMRAERGEVSHNNHLCLLVRCDDSPATWLADVGAGGSLLEPIELQVAAYSHGPFELGLRRLDEDEWQFWENVGDGEFSFDFVAEPGSEQAMSDRCDYLQSSPESGFVRNLVVQIREPDAHHCLRGRLLRTAGPAGVEERVLDSVDELVEVLGNRFRLDVPDIVDLWPKIEARHRAISEDHS